MTHDIRIKFVAVTMTLMITVFGTLLAAFFMYNQYWSDIDTLQSIEWIADSGVFLYKSNNDDDVRVLAEELAGEDNPVIGIILDKTGNVLNRKTIGNNGAAAISDETVTALFHAGRDVWKYRSFIFTKRQIDDGKTLIVLADASYEKGRGVRILVNGMLVFAGIVLLTAVSFYLSRFVAAPAERSLQREKRFITDASHELKTPLGAISINAQALAVTDGENIHVKNIVSETQRMNRLIERLLTLSRMDEEAPVLKEQCDLSASVLEMTLTFESVAFEKQIDYQYDIENEIRIKGNVDELKQLTAILLDNAIKNTPRDGSIFTSLKRGVHKTGAILEVRNTGAGIAWDDLPHVFERFYSGAHAPDNTSFGLGLSIAKSITERHKGTIKAHSEAGEYTSFLVLL